MAKPQRPTPQDEDRPPEFTDTSRGRGDDDVRGRSDEDRDADEFDDDDTEEAPGEEDNI